MLRRKRPALAKMVKQILNRNEETKIVSTTLAYTGFNSSITATGDALTVLPQVPQGVSQSGRIGSAITPLKLVIRGYIVYRADAYQPAVMLGGRLFCWSDKTVSNYAISTSAGQLFNLLDAGGTSQTFDGTVTRYELPHNTDQFRFYADKKFRVLKPFGYTNTLGTSSTTAIASMDKSMYHPFTITIPASKMPKMLKYDSTLSANYPTNFAPYLSLGYCDLMTYGPDVTPTQLGMSFTSTLYYKDA